MSDLLQNLVRTLIASSGVACRKQTHATRTTHRQLIDQNKPNPAAASIKQQNLLLRLSG